MGNTASQDTVSTDTTGITPNIPPLPPRPPPEVSLPSSSSFTVGGPSPRTNRPVHATTTTELASTDDKNRNATNTKRTNSSSSTGTTINPPPLPSLSKEPTSSSSSSSSSSSTVVSSSSAATSSSSTVSATATVEPPPRSFSSSSSSSSSSVTWYRQAMDGYDMIINAIIRPPRANDYSEKDLGPKYFSYHQKTYQREDGKLTNSRGQTIVWSQWKPTSAYPVTPSTNTPLPSFVSSSSSSSSSSTNGRSSLATLPCVIYLHGNSSCRAGAVADCLLTTLDEGATVFAFDFTGSGKSDGEFVTLGFNESKDIADVITFVRKEGRASSIALWGRSMGATTALLYAATDPLIAGLVLDSPFADLRRLCCELVGIGSASLGINQRLLTFGLPLALRIIRSSVKQRSGLDIFDLHPITTVPLAHVPVLFVAGLQDDFIVPQHSIDLHKAYGPPNNPDIYKLIRIIPGDHNSVRSAEFHNYAGGFLRRTLACDGNGVGSSSTQSITVTPSLNSSSSAASLSSSGKEITNAKRSNNQTKNTLSSSSSSSSLPVVPPPVLPPIVPSTSVHSSSRSLTSNINPNNNSNNHNLPSPSTLKISRSANQSSVTTSDGTLDTSLLPSSSDAIPFDIISIPVGTLPMNVHSAAAAAINNTTTSIKLSNSANNDVNEEEDGSMHNSLPSTNIISPITNGTEILLSTSSSSLSSSSSSSTSSSKVVIMENWREIQEAVEEDELLAIALSLQSPTAP